MWNIKRRCQSVLINIAFSQMNAIICHNHAISTPEQAFFHAGLCACNADYIWVYILFFYSADLLWLILCKRGSENKPKQTNIRSGWEVLTFPQHSSSRYGDVMCLFAWWSMHLLNRTQHLLISVSFSYSGRWVLSAFFSQGPVFSSVKLDIQYSRSINGY